MERDAFHVSYLSDKIPEVVFHGQAVKTVAYLRVSTAQQDVRSQRLAILEYARKHDFRIDDFIEATASGQASEKRRRLDELMNVLQRGDRLVVSELSRLGRSLGQIVAILDALAKGSLGVSRFNGKEDAIRRFLEALRCGAWRVPRRWLNCTGRASGSGRSRWWSAAGLPPFPVNYENRYRYKIDSLS